MNERQILERPFPPELIRHRPGRNGEDVTYIEAHVVIGRLNEALAGEWSFTVERHDILADEVIVLGRLTAGPNTKCAFGSSAITRTRDGGKPVSIGDDLKAAATDALKKAATLLGVGLNLQASAPAPVSSTTAAPDRPAKNGNGLLSEAQLRAIHAIRRRLGWSEAQLAEFARREANADDVERLDKRAASVLIERLQAAGTPAGAAP